MSPQSVSMTAPSTPDDATLDNMATSMGLLSDKTRLGIVLKLAKGPSNVTDLCKHLKLPQPTVSHHLGLLRMNRLIVNKRAGKQVVYSLPNATSDKKETHIVFAV